MVFEATSRLFTGGCSDIAGVTTCTQPIDLQTFVVMILLTLFLYLFLKEIMAKVMNIHQRYN